MNLRAIAAYQQAAPAETAFHQRRTAEHHARQQQPMQQSPALAAPLVVEQFTRNGQPQRIALGVYLDKRV
jgi:hypothetical protein